MTCHRICRELVMAARFGELGPGSTPHLEHLAECRSCREELGFDRALVRQLRTALAARVEGATPSPRAWEGVLARMAAPEDRPSRVRAWSTALVARLRFGSAMAGATLAVVMALNVDIVPVRPSDAASQPTLAPAGAPARPLTLADGFSQAELSPGYARSSTPEIESTTRRGPAVVGVAPKLEQLPLAGAGGEPNVATADDTAPPEPDAGTTETWQPLTVRLVPADAAIVDGGSDEPSTPAPATEPQSSPPVSGAPS